MINGQNERMVPKSEVLAPYRRLSLECPEWHDEGRVQHGF